MFPGTRDVIASRLSGLVLDAFGRQSSRPASTVTAPACSTVFVWAPLGEHVGHAAMAIGDQRPDASWDRQNVTYVSWWPSNAPHAGSHDLSFKNDFANDCTSEGGPPESIIEVRGLDDIAMYTAWTQISSKANAHYRFMVKNCSTIVARYYGRAWRRSLYGRGWLFNTGRTRSTGPPLIFASLPGRFPSSVEGGRPKPCCRRPPGSLSTARS
jgi:hypothetical protein